MSKPGGSRTVVPIQVLRAVAALAVLFPHVSSDFARYLNMPDALPAFPMGGAGVDLFFVISGFVMVYASEPLYAQPNGSLTFFTHRVIRIVPLYWLVTTLYLAVSITVPNFLKDYPAAFLAASYLFIPLPRPDGVIEPLVGQGWTLNYEMLFYAIFAVAVLAPRRKATAFACLALIGIVAIGQAVPSLPTIFKSWSDPILFEFIFGMLIGLGYREGLALSRPLALATISGGVALLVASEYFPLFNSRALLWGAPAAIVVAGAAFGRFSLSSPIWRPLVILGDASYALYLFHPIPGRALIVLSRWMHFDIARIPWTYFAASVFSAVALAVAIHFLIESPLTKYLRQRAVFARIPSRHAAGLSNTAGKIQLAPSALAIPFERNQLSP